MREYDLKTVMSMIALAKETFVLMQSNTNFQNLRGYWKMKCYTEDDNGNTGIQNMNIVRA